VSNTSFTATRGWDASAGYGFSVGGNAFIADATFTHIIAFNDQLTSTSPVIQAVNRPYRPPAWRGRGGLVWERGGWNGSFFLNYAGPYRDDRSTIVRRVHAYATADVSLSYTFAKTASRPLSGTRLSLFAENLFDADPPRLVPDPGSTRGLGYDPVNASARGRFVALQLRKSW
jgi:hypothetical protein